MSTKSPWGPRVKMAKRRGGGQGGESDPTLAGAQNMTSKVGKTPKPPLWLGPWTQGLWSGRAQEPQAGGFSQCLT